MAIVNRTLDSSEQRKVFVASRNSVATGVTGIICQVPWPCTLDSGQIALTGISGAPNYALLINRFIVGSGATTFTLAVGTSNIPLAWGTSGPWSIVLPAAGSTLLSLQANDVITFQSGVSNAAADSLAFSLVLKPLQDIKYHFGSASV